MLLPWREAAVAGTANDCLVVDAHRERFCLSRPLLDRQHRGVRIIAKRIAKYAVHAVRHDVRFHQLLLLLTKLTEHGLLKLFVRAAAFRALNLYPSWFPLSAATSNEPARRLTLV